MTRIITRAEMEHAIGGTDLVPAIEEGFVAYAQGQAVVPPVGELLLPNGEVHIKYGYLVDDDHYVIKVASGFPGNVDQGLAPNNGLMLVCSQADGEIAAVLLDEGWLTDVRTAVAGAVVAKHLAPNEVTRIGIVGTGVQARLQLHHLASVTGCREVAVWGRTPERVDRFLTEMADGPFTITAEPDVAAVARSCNLIVTTTASTEPLVALGDVEPGTHVTAVGSDTPTKHEVETAMLRDAEVVVADSLEQCLLRGEIHQAIAAGHLEPSGVQELGHVISGVSQGRTDDSQITVADLTGVAVQDIKIAAAVLAALPQGG